MTELWDSNWRLPAYLAGCAILGTCLGVLAGSFWLPLLQAAPVYPLYLWLVRRGEWFKCVGWMAAWAFLLALVVGLGSGLWPGLMESQILNAGAYQQEMFQWITTGVGQEGNIRLFLPEHLLHAGVFSAVSLVTGGAAGLVMGSALMNYMSFYVGTLVAASDAPFLALCLAWPPWAAVRVLAFICLAVALTGLILQCSGRAQTWSRGRPVRFIRISLVLLCLDIVLKWCLAPVWQPWLKVASGF